MNNLLLQIQEDVKDAMRAKEVGLLGTLRLLLAAIKQHEIDKRVTLDDYQIISIVDKMIRQRYDAIEQYKKGNRQDLVDKEAAEISILEKYMPQILTDTEIKSLISEAMITTCANSIKDMSKVMAYIKTKANGRIDIKEISIVIKNLLEKNT
ncbi:MAG: GatB/YqeY domain-containing protein [Coxiellaceae bacterium]|jgi:uncharacterized protein YqeY|nr:GatB/YqeY domain-containing protein [Coxiellaceae bacterium]